MKGIINPKHSLFHFTSIENFLSIEKSMKLYFSNLSRVNDLSECLVPTQQISNRLDIENYIRENGKVLSFTDRASHQRMWAQYAKYGVCLELNFSNLISKNERIIKQYKIYGAKIKYTTTKRRKTINNLSIVPQKEIEKFIRENKSAILYSKNSDWRDEKEYRFIALTREPISFSIKDSIDSVYINSPIGELKKLLDKREHTYKTYDWRTNISFPINNKIIG